MFLDCPAEFMDGYPPATDPERIALDAFCADERYEMPSRRVVLIAAHPDDEVIGAGARLSVQPDTWVVHVTDGAPRDGRDALALGFQNRAAYARARAAEGIRALAVAGVDPSTIIDLEFVDQEATTALVAITRRLTTLLEELRPEIIVTHPYEGGHPDHDATAFAVHSAVHRLGNAGHARPSILEMTSYHARGADLATGDFLPATAREVRTIALDGDLQRLKHKMFACYRTQRRVLAAFALDCERFRIAPRYDFSEPPHPGQLFYERFPWGMTGARWRSHATRALHTLEGQSALSAC